MPNNMIDANKDFFNNIIDFLDEDNKTNVIDCVRYLKTDSKEKEWLKKTKILLSYRISKRTIGLLLKYDTKKYFCLISDASLEKHINLDELASINDNAGLATLLGAKGFLIPTTSDNSVIINELRLDMHVTDEDSKYLWEEIKQLFPVIRCYEIVDSEYIKIEENKNLFFKLMSKAVFQLHLNDLNFKRESSIPAWEKIIFEKETNAIVYKNILLAFCASSWEISYLYLYQCIEEMMAVLSLKELRKALDLNISERQLNHELYDKLQWQPKDIEGLNAIIENCNQEYSQAIPCLNEIAGSEKLSKYIYSTRNRIVHETRDPIIPVEDEESWDKLITGMLYLIYEITI